MSPGSYRQDSPSTDVDQYEDAMARAEAYFRSRLRLDSNDPKGYALLAAARALVTDLLESLPDEERAALANEARRIVIRHFGGKR